MQIGKLEWLMVDQQQHAVLWCQQSFDTDVRIARVSHGRSLPEMGGLKCCN
jgi:hypothetical protein